MIENILKRWQIKRALDKAKKVADTFGIIVSPHMLKFHNVDRREAFKNLWNKKYGDEKITDERILKLYS